MPKEKYSDDEVRQLVASGQVKLKKTEDGWTFVTSGKNKLDKALPEDAYRFVDKSAPVKAEPSKSSSTPASSATPGADEQIRQAEEIRKAALEAAKKKISEQQAQLNQTTNESVNNLNTQVTQLLSSLATQQQPDYAAQYQQAYQTQIDQMRQQFEQARQQSEQTYQQQVQQLKQQYEQSDQQVRAALEQQKQEYQGFMQELLKPKLAQFQAGQFEDTTGQLGQSYAQQQQEALANLEKLKQVYAFDPSTQAQLEQEYRGLLSNIGSSYSAGVEDYRRMLNEGKGRFVTGQYEASQVPVLYSQQSAFQQNLSAKQQGLLTQLQQLQGVGQDITRRVQEDAARIQSQRQQEKQTILAGRTQRLVGEAQQRQVSKQSQQNINRQQRTVGTKPNQSLLSSMIRR